MLTRRTDTSERGAAMIAAIIMLIIGGLLVGAFMMTVTNTRDRGRDSTDKSVGAGAAEDGVRAYVAALSASTIGEHTGFAMTRDALLATVRESDAGAGICASDATDLCLVPNANTAFPGVDDRLIAATDRFTVRRRVGNGQYRFWQVVAVAPPRYGALEAGRVASPGGSAILYVRGWQGGAARTAGNVVRPVVLRAEVRPNSFADYQVLTDGKILMGDDFTINGRVHTNGMNQSYFDQYASLPDSITVPAGATCTATARMSTAAGSIGTAGGSCNNPSMKFAGTKENYSLLRAVATADEVRAHCGQASPVVVRCISNPNPAFRGPYSVTMAGSTITIAGYGSVSAANTRLTFPTAGGATGAAIIFDRSVHVRGTLGPNARATIFAMNDKATALAEVPSIWVRSAGLVGSTGATTTAVGLVAEGDVVADEAAACPLNIRAALLAQGGMLSMNPQHRGAVLPGAPTCNQPALITGSVTGHFPPYLRIGDTNGYIGQRRYDYDPNLYHNPPPFFPTSTTWKLLTSTSADAECFTGPETAPRLVDAAGCR
ncbi:MAG: hypothetical protein JWO69_423 [Thermoleophilia bacterium]|nr:hypothetical protein [Thermoleophilia bacterium]